jgi:hypothetical protein
LLAAAQLKQTFKAFVGSTFAVSVLIILAMFIFLGSGWAPERQYRCAVSRNDACTHRMHATTTAADRVTQRTHVPRALTHHR